MLSAPGGNKRPVELVRLHSQHHPPSGSGTGLPAGPGHREANPSTRVATPPTLLPAGRALAIGIREGRRDSGSL